MKALSIRQPFAELIVSGEKDVENRTWRTDYRGPVLVHAAQRLADGTAWVRTCEDHGVEWWNLDTGGIVGIADLVDCVEESESEWFHGPYGFVLANARRLPFRPLRGMPGLFDVPVT